MALMTVDFYSEVLGLSTEVTVILPQKEQGIGMVGSVQKDRYPVLWLLHGMSDDHTIWLRRTSIERYVSDLGLAVVMPNVHLSFYSDMKHGPNYFTYITEELPRVMREFFPLSDKREENFVCGLSMGGYGAMKVGLSCPEQYAAIGCFSAGNFPYWEIPTESDAPTTDTVLQNIWGIDTWRDLIGSDDDLYVMAEKIVAAKQPLPQIYHVCGTEDFLIDNARDTRDWFTASPFDYSYREAPGIHDWAFWDFWIQDYLKWLSPYLNA